jgi:hypothetical protein
MQKDIVIVIGGLLQQSLTRTRPQVKYLRVPDEIVDIVKEQQATAQAQRGGGHRGGRGDRGDRGGRGGRGMGGRGRGRGGRGQAA